MELHKWCANNEMLLENVPTEDQGYQFGDSDKDTVKTLALRWNPKEDCLNFTITPSESVPTKRTVLADIAKSFDPLGFLFFSNNCGCKKLNGTKNCPIKRRSNGKRLEIV
ncbi:hypothetical protein AVEN_164479-1 [Araneus ventricosus]|uniref:Uncharacterized protein n=1 Tax=Araneus ventricosus TaxID=182803 RepID=A0A4Y2IS07_ARAVE|nr:hypothetical protein AVEN_164479-1 [Araneus ventricosus]